MKTSIIISILITILDQIIKFIIDKKVLFIEILPKLFNIHKVYNYGVAFSFLENKRYLILLFSLILIYFLFNLPKTKKYDILFGVILGGIIGNLIDRVFRGYVIDYLETFIFGISFPIFNLADICITLGIILMVLIMSLGDKK